MHVAVRSPLATGVALVGAGAIALAPVQLQVPDVNIPTISSAAVQLTAQPNPIALWSQVFAGAIENMGGLGDEVLSDPFPVLRQILKNQFGYLQTVGNAGKGIIDGLMEYASPDNPFGLQAGIRDAFAQMEAGDIAAGFSTLTSTLVIGPLVSGIGLPLLMSGLLQVPGAIAQNLADAVGAIFDNANIVPLLTAVAGPIVAPINAFGASVEDFVEALGAGNIVDAITTVINVPARIVGAVLNGYTDVQGNFLPGLLTVSDNPFTAGLLQALFVNIPRAIATALGAEPVATQVSTPVADEVASPVSEAAATVTISLGETDSAAAEVTPADETASQEPTEAPAVADEVDVDETPVEDVPAGEGVETPAADDVADDVADEDAEPTAEDPAVDDDAPAADEDEAGTEPDSSADASAAGEASSDPSAE